MRPYYLTTPIYYVNDAPHVGTAYTTVNADALARWHRLLGDDVWFMTGTDEHGAKIVEAAEANGTTPKDWTDRTSARFVEAWRRLDISNDDFIRTTEPRHYAVVQQFLQRIHDNGYIEMGSYTGLYCVSCEDYYLEDQLIDGNCPVHGRPVIAMQEDNYFFRLSQFEQRLLDYYDSHPDFVRPTSKRNEALGFIRGGLRDVSITRTSFSWGVPVPWDSGHVFYVWYDALINYLTVAGYGSDDAVFEDRWGAAHHLIGKDILKFHCVWWPAMCMAAGIDPPAQIFVHGYLLMGGQKLGKTMIASGRAGGDDAAPLKITDVSPLALADDFGVDPLRYHLLRDVVLGGDGDFSYEGIVARYNADLANNLGNLVSRVTTVVTSKCGGIGPGCNAGSELGPVAAAVVEAASAAWARWAPHEALEETWRLIGAANVGLEAAEPWKMEPGPEVDAVLGDALEVLRIVAVLIAAAMPTTAREVWRRIGVEGDPTAAPRARGRPVGRVRRRDGRGEGRPPLPAAEGLSVGGLVRLPLPRPGGVPPRGGGRRGGPGARPAPRRRGGRGPHDLHRDRDRDVGPGGGRGPGHGVVGVAPAGVGVHRPPSARSERGCGRGGGAVGAGAGGGRRRGGRRRGVRAGLFLRAFSARRATGRVRRGDRARACARAGAGDPRARRLARCVRRVGGRRRSRRTVLHCFTGGPDEVTQCLRAGMFVSFSGIVTFKNAADVRAAVALCPLERLLVETDSPFLAPVPHRGRTNEPSYLPLVGEAIAAVKGCTVDEVKERSAAAASMVFSTGG